MSTFDLENFKKILFEEIVNEINRKQHVPVSFNDIDIAATEENKFEGTLDCSEPSRTWKIPVVAEICGNEVHWIANDMKWYSFKMGS